MNFTIMKIAVAVIRVFELGVLFYLAAAIHPAFIAMAVLHLLVDHLTSRIWVHTLTEKIEELQQLHRTLKG